MTSNVWRYGTPPSEADVFRAFQAASSTAAGVDVKNVLFMGPPSSELAGASNMAAPAGHFVDATQHDYRLRSTSPAIDAGISLTAVTTDRLGVARPMQRHWDVGAFEYAPADLGARGGSSR